MKAPPATAFVLTAGLGTRMRPLTDSRPKALVEVAGRTLIDRILDRIAAAGIGTAVLNLHYMGDRLRSHLAGRASPAIQYSDETGRLLDTGGGAKKALPLLGPGPFLTHNCDSIWIEGLGSNLDRLIAGYDPDRMDSLMLVAPLTTSIGFDGPGDFTMDAHGRLTRREEKRIAPFVSAGVQIIHPRLFENTPDTPFSMNLVWDRAIAQGRLFGLRLDGLWMHIGTPLAVTEAEAALAQH
ncbi:MAG: nucleotidyltransferase family protein [Alphaproteobacteria bacterium]|nr:nucleotidyltransferase family protein [Alphaproteobacteria bacterium]